MVDVNKLENVCFAPLPRFYNLRMSNVKANDDDSIQTS